jgi:DNA-binding CsgD family transcriptional regulator
MTINLTADELSANQRGIMSYSQRAALQKQRLVWLVGTMGLVLLLAFAALLIFLKLQDRSFAARGELVLVIPVGLLWLWLLREAPRQWVRAGRDLRSAHVDCIEGAAHGDLRGGVGIIQTAKYYVCIGETCFRVPKAHFLQIRTGERYRVYYAPASRMFFGGMLLASEAEAEAAMQAVDAPPLLEPLSAQEREILRLIAEGYSNKEIATRLSLSINTIKMYASQIYRKLGVSRRTEAVAHARALDLL